ncbi:HIT family protein [Candidatus Kuenenbacteria bacterium HGW-Kuenenbacteria-1]|uniref:HIT family protein n=1 Tax=Candidatus Kuenenbacteria bacterium HGW-Kuenenbacteria-1 TaxID=2013812 RepID=A0A2N1UMR2_9BACT|nr:MAG: HIT family protein [Candidatus Kuenenbacteria bacterium HGW-Kuenenbacteria-1]
MACVFCKIIKKEIPYYGIYEDESVLAFLDIAPVNYGHTIVVPKKHYANFEEISDEELCKVIKVVKKIGKAIIKGLKIRGYNIFVNNNPVAGQVISHMHFHVVPRTEEDGLQLWAQGKYEEGEAEKVMKKIQLGLI